MNKADLVDGSLEGVVEPKRSRSDGGSDGNEGGSDSPSAMDCWLGS